MDYGERFSQRQDAQNLAKLANMSKEDPPATAHTTGGAPGTAIVHSFLVASPRLDVVIGLAAEYLPVEVGVVDCNFGPDVVVKRLIERIRKHVWRDFGTRKVGRENCLGGAAGLLIVCRYRPTNVNIVGDRQRRELRGQWRGPSSTGGAVISRYRWHSLAGSILRNVAGGARSLIGNRARKCIFSSAAGISTATRVASAARICVGPPPGSFPSLGASSVSRHASPL